MQIRSTPLHRLASRASVLAALALPVLAPAQTPPIPAPTYVELSRKVEVVAGREVIVIRVRPPLLPPPPPPAPVGLTPPPPSTAELQEELRLAAQKHASLTVIATVYAGPPVLTELRWTAAGRDWVAFSNIDFHALTQLSQIETGDTVWQWFPFVTDGDAAGRPNPPGLAFSGPEAEYVVYASQAEWEAAPEAFAVLDWLHARYEERRADFDAALALRRAEKARRDAEPPPLPKPVIIRYYQPLLPPVAPNAEGGAK